MCYEIIEQYACGHETTYFTKCKEAYENGQTYSNHRQFLLEEQKDNIFSKMFRAVTSKKPPRYSKLNKLCNTCERKEDERRLRTPPPQAPYDFAEVRARQILRATKDAKAGKERFVCSKCTREGLPVVYQSQRAANNGLCCEHGIKEWETVEKLTKKSVKFDFPKIVESSLPRRANTQPERRNVAPTNVYSRVAANQALREDGWGQDELRGRPKTAQERTEIIAVKYNPPRARARTVNKDYTCLEPKVAKDLFSLPTGLELPTQRTEQGTYYVEPSIDYDRWDSHTQTNHGRIPAPPHHGLPPTPPNSERAGDLRNLKSAPQAPSRKPEPHRSGGSSYQRQPPPWEQQRYLSKPLPPTPDSQGKSSSRGTSSGEPLLRRQTEQPLANPQVPRHRSLRSVRGREWTDSLELGGQTSRYDTFASQASRLSRPFQDQPAWRTSQDITHMPPAATSPVSYSPVSPLNNSRFPDNLEGLGYTAAPFRASRHRTPSLEAVDRMDDDIDDLLHRLEGVGRNEIEWNRKKSERHR